MTHARAQVLRAALLAAGLLALYGGAPAVRADDLASLETRFRDLPMEARCLTGPLFWLHGDESEERLRDYVAKVAEGGNGCFTAESRPHSDWLGEGWFRDLGVCLDAAKQHDLRMWIFDEKWWPSGEVAGNVPTRYGSKRLEASETPVVGGGAVSVEVDPERLVAVLAGRHDGAGIEGDGLVDLTAEVRDGQVSFVAPPGDWRVMVFTWRYSAGPGERVLVDGASREAVQWYIDTVYQPHYDRFGEDFGKTIAGYFYDEPETPGDYGSELLPTLAERRVDWKRVLVARKFALSSEDEQTAGRYQYQDAFAETWGRTLYGGLTKWCEERRVLSIGHWLEHWREYLNPEVCAGDMFQLERFSAMGALDAIGAQFAPGVKDDSTYQTPKLGSSITHAYGKQDDVTMVEIFGARGQDLTYPEMKWWTDHMQTSGVNFLIPHSFNPRSPYDTDCPPFFYNGGYEPRWPLYRVYADYTSRLAELLTRGRHVCPVALMYLGSSAHVGPAIPPEEMTTALQDALFDCDWLPYDVVANDLRIDGATLALREERYRVLALPAVEAIPYEPLAKAKAFFDAGGIVIGYGMLPSRSASFGVTSTKVRELRDAIFGPAAEPGLALCRRNARGGRAYFLPAKPSSEEIRRVLTDDAGLHPTLEVLEGDTSDWLHVLHRVKDGHDVFLLASLAWNDVARDLSLRLQAEGYPEVWDAVRGEVTSTPFTRQGDTVDLPLTLQPGESALIVFSHERRALPRRVTEGDIARMRRLPVRRIDLPEEPEAIPPAPTGAAHLRGSEWVWHAADGAQPGPCRRAFRASFELAATPASASLAIAADNEYVLYVNGELIGAGSAWDRPDRYDVAGSLRAGRNVLAITGANGGQAPNPAGIVLSLDLGEGRVVRTDASWRSSADAPEGFEQAGFDDSAWPVVAVLGPYGMAPWGQAGGGVTLSPVLRADPYEGNVEAPAEVLGPGWRVFLMAGEIAGERSARVTVNGEDAGGFLCDPARLDVTRFLRPGANRLRLEPLAPSEVWLGALPPEQ